MALNFPINPTVGQFYTAEGGTWIWNGTQWTGTAETSIIASDTPPLNPIGGTLWYKTSASVGLYFWFVDPDSSQWIDVGNGSSLTPTEGDTRYLRLIGGTMTGPINLPAPTAPEHAANMAYVDSVAAGGGGGTSFLPLTGGTLSGPLLLPAADPVDPAEAAHKAYVDAAVAAGGGGSDGITEAEADLRYLKLAGGTLTGALLLPATAPTLPEHATTKAYVDAAVAAGGGGGGSGTAVYVGATPPASPVLGQLWYATVEPVGEFIWMNDGNTTQWVQTNGASGGITQAEGDVRYLALVGGSLSGPLVLPIAAPTLPEHAVNKAYADATYFPMAGGTVTTGFTSSNTQPHFTLYETDAGANLKSWRFWSVSGRLDIHPRSDGNVTGTGALSLTRTTSNLTDAQLTGGPLAAPTANSIMTMARCDARYAPIVLLDDLIAQIEDLSAQVAALKAGA